MVRSVLPEIIHFGHFELGPIHLEHQFRGKSATDVLARFSVESGGERDGQRQTSSWFILLTFASTSERAGRTMDRSCFRLALLIYVRLIISKYSGLFTSLQASQEKIRYLIIFEKKQLLQLVVAREFHTESATQVSQTGLSSERLFFFTADPQNVPHSTFDLYVRERRALTAEALILLFALSLSPFFLDRPGKRGNPVGVVTVINLSIIFSTGQRPTSDLTWHTRGYKRYSD